MLKSIYGKYKKITIANLSEKVKSKFMMSPSELGSSVIERLEIDFPLCSLDGSLEA